MRNIAFESSKTCEGKRELYIILCIAHILFTQGAIFLGCLTLCLNILD